MSAIPPDIAGAAAQAGLTSAIAARARDADRTGQAQIADRQQQVRLDKAASVEAEDMDTAVFADAEGAGGQGRAPADDITAEHPAEETAAAVDDADGARHIDIEA